MGMRVGYASVKGMLGYACSMRECDGEKGMPVVCGFDSGMRHNIGSTRLGMRSQVCGVNWSKRTEFSTLGVF